MVLIINFIKFVILLLFLLMIFTKFNCFSITTVPDNSKILMLLAFDTITYTVHIKIPNLSKPKSLNKF